MTRTKMACLKANGWLNDEVSSTRGRVDACRLTSPFRVCVVFLGGGRHQVINFYMCMLKERDDLLCAKQPGRRRKSHFFNSFFMERLLISDRAYKYSNVRRWTKKFKSFEMDKIFFPVRRFPLSLPVDHDPGWVVLTVPLFLLFAYATVISAGE